MNLVLTVDSQRNVSSLLFRTKGDVSYLHMPLFSYAHIRSGKYYFAIHLKKCCYVRPSTAILLHSSVSYNEFDNCVRPEKFYALLMSALTC